MIYKIYKCRNHGYEEAIFYPQNEMIEYLDEEILHKETKSKILVIEHDKTNDSDFPIFLHLGVKKDYLDFREKFIENKQKILKK